MLAPIRRTIVAQWRRIVRAARTRPVTVPASPTLLGNSTKVRKGPDAYATRVVYQAPAREAFKRGDKRTACAHASRWCEALCLGHSTGLLITSTSQRARLWKAALYFGDRSLWRALFAAEVDAWERACARSGVRAVVRADGSTDLGEGQRTAHAFPGVQLYDYTKNPKRVLRADGSLRALPSNYDLTFSYSGTNRDHALRVLAAGGRVAVVFDTDPRTGIPAFPDRLWGFPVVTGDADDLRFRDPGGVVVALAFKQARARAAALDRAGPFVVRVADVT